MTNTSDVALSAEDIDVLKCVQCNFYGENPTTHQESILQYLEDQKLVKSVAFANRVQWRLTADGTKMLHCVTAKEEQEMRNRNHNWAIALFSVIGAGIFVLLAALL